MVAISAILVFVCYLVFFFPLETKEKKKEVRSPKYTAQMKKLWQIAQTSMKERKPFRAEKALLTILKFDEKNAAAYNRLGILYAKGQKYDEAVECFEIAQSLDNNPASIHNVGLIYLETGAYEKAAMAFNQAIELEGDIPARFLALSKAEEKLGNYKKAVEALENAYELDPKITTLRQILAIHENNGDAEAVEATAARIETQMARDEEFKKRRALTNKVRKNNLSRGEKVLDGRRASKTTKAGPKSANRVQKTHVGRKRI
ncbi:tetratricopeptide repeat protein [Candidatus Saccharibacteria bacterium]|nr:tetratricopeptide repeat protein [Candidatus Saccharibacteria bacterium]